MRSQLCLSLCLCLAACATTARVADEGDCLHGTYVRHKPTRYTVNGSDIGDTLPELLLDHARTHDDALVWQQHDVPARGLGILGVMTSAIGLITLSASSAAKHPAVDREAGAAVVGVGIAAEIGAIALSQVGNSSRRRAIATYNDDANAEGSCSPRQ